MYGFGGGINPAGAGSSLPSSTASVVARDQPRGCGEQITRTDIISRLLRTNSEGSGASRETVAAEGAGGDQPRMRGDHGFAAAWELTTAGQPHMRGDHLATVRPDRTLTGPTPRVREQGWRAAPCASRGAQPRGHGDHSATNIHDMSMAGPTPHAREQKDGEPFSFFPQGPSPRARGADTR